MSVISEKVRNMNDTEKMAYYLQKFVSSTDNPNVESDCISVISDLLKGVDINDIFKQFNLTGTIDTDKTPVTITIRVPNTDKDLTFDVAVEDRDQFDGAKPEAEAKPIKSFLTDKEKKEIEEATGVQMDK